MSPTRNILSLVVFALAFGLASVASTRAARRAPAQAAPGPGAELHSLADIHSAGYFSKLDYYQPAIAAEIPAFERKLVAAAESARASLGDPAHATESALILAYAALYMANADYGTLAGKITYAALTEFARYGDTATLDSEIAGRNRAITAYLRDARVASPADHRIEDWLAGAELRQGETDHPGVHDPKAFDGILDAAHNDPLFCLFSALILANDRELTPEQTSRLDQLVDWMTGKQGPCNGKNQPAACHPGGLWPFAQQGSASLLGDAYLRRAIRLRASTDPKDRKAWHADAIKAFVIYESALFGHAGSVAKHWPYRAALRERRHLAFKLGFGNKPVDPSYWNSEREHQVYSCASCHHGG
jgi:hypothetical protein